MTPHIVGALLELTEFLVGTLEVEDAKDRCLLTLELRHVAKLISSETEHQGYLLVPASLNYVIGHPVKSVLSLYPFKVDRHNDHLQVLSIQMLHDLFHPNNVALLEVTLGTLALFGWVHLAIKV